MAKVKLNPALEAIQGKIGDLSFKRWEGDQTTNFRKLNRKLCRKSAVSIKFSTKVAIKVSESFQDLGLPSASSWAKWAVVTRFSQASNTTRAHDRTGP